MVTGMPRRKWSDVRRAAAGEREETRAIENAFKLKMKTLYEKRVKELEAMQHDFEQVRFARCLLSLTASRHVLTCLSLVIPVRPRHRPTARC